MTVKALAELFEYGYWANRRLFAVMEQLTAEQLTQQIAGGHGSIRNTMVHMVSAEAGWLDRCGGPNRGPRLKPEDFPTLDSIHSGMEHTRKNVTKFLTELNEEDLTRRIEFSLNQPETYSLRLGELMQHAGLHGVHHRGQIALLLRLLGYTPGNFDILLFYLEKSAPPAKR